MTPFLPGVPRRRCTRAFPGVPMADPQSVAILALVFAAAVVTTSIASLSMEAMGEMAMPGGWSMSMTFMRMPGQTWAGLVASFLGMWMPMMVAMMLPSLAPALVRYRHAMAGRDAWAAAGVTCVVAAAYFTVWAGLGLVVLALGVAGASVAMALPALAPAVPAAAGMVVVVAGALQLSSWKARQLRGCRSLRACNPDGDARLRNAWRHGLRLGRHCGTCCAGPTAILMVLGVMDLRAMAVVGAGITVERLARDGQRVASVLGIVAIAAGALLIVRAMVG